MSDGEVVWVASNLDTGNWVEGATALETVAEYAVQYGNWGTIRLALCHRDGDAVECYSGSPFTRGSYDDVYDWALTAH